MTEENNLENLEMIDNHIFYIKRKPNFYGLEIIEVESLKEVQEKSYHKLNEMKNLNINVKVIFEQNLSKYILCVIYSSESLKNLKEVTSLIKLAGEEEIRMNLNFKKEQNTYGK